MKPEEITIELGAKSVEAVTIYKRQAVENAKPPRFGARGPNGERLISRGEYLVLRIAGAKDETPGA